MVSKKICGQRFNPGDPIPSTGLWSKTGRTYKNGNCYAVNGGQMYYAYDFPTNYVSNTGFDTLETDLMYFVQDDAGNVSDWCGWRSCAAP